MAEGGTPADFERWVEPRLTTVALYAGRRTPADRDDVVRQSLIRAYQRWSTYDASRSTRVAWLLGIVASECRSHRVRQPARDVVELVDGAGSGVQTRDIDLERAVEGLPRRERLVVDLHYFVGLDIPTVAEVAQASPGTVEATLRQARERLRQLVGTTMDDLMDQRLTAAALRWQEEQPPPPAVPVERLDEHLRRGSPGAVS